MKTLFIIAFTLVSYSALAGDVTVTNAVAKKTAENTYSFDVTLQHNDAGWDHYANQWQILTPGHKVLGTRTLHHPHSERPFTRSLSGVKIPAGLTSVIVKARDSVHGVSEQEYKLTLP